MDDVARTNAASRTGSRIADSGRAGASRLFGAVAVASGALPDARVGRPHLAWFRDGASERVGRLHSARSRAGDALRSGHFAVLKGGSESVDNVGLRPPFRPQRNRVDDRY